MDVNSEGIYNSKALAPYKEDNICMTQQANGNSYFFYLAEKEETKIPAEIHIKSHQPKKGAEVTLLGYSKSLSWKKEGNGFKVKIPKKLRNNPPSKYVWTIKVSAI